MGVKGRHSDSHLALSIALALLLTLTTTSLAQSTLDKLRQHDKELETVRSQQRQAADTEARLKREIGNIGDDRRKLNQTLIEAASRLRTVEGRVADTEARLKPLDDSERGIRQSLGGRRAAIAEVLASLQRIGRNPPPAMMVRPEDALASIRTAIMLGAVLPDMRIQAESLAADLSDLVRIRRDIAEEKERLQRDVAALTEERQRVTLLIEERQKKQAGYREGHRGRAPEDRLFGPPGRQSQRFDRKSRTGPRRQNPLGTRRRPCRRGKITQQPSRFGGPQRPRTARTGGGFCVGARTFTASG